jgi:hypothetical protein
LKGAQHIHANPRSLPDKQSTGDHLYARPKNDPKGIHIAQDDTYSNSTRPIVTHGSQPIT